MGRAEEFGADYYRARAAEMMEKAQNAPTKAIRIAYLNLAHCWTGQAEKLEAAARADWSGAAPSPANDAPQK